MAGPNLPSIAELGQMEFMSPMAYQQAQGQIGLANQFANQNLAMGGQDLQAKQLANLFQQQADPMRLQQMQLANEGTGNANVISGVNSRIASSTEEEAKAARRAELLAKASDDELKALRTQAEKEYESDDPAVRSRGEKKLMASVAEFNRRNKQKDNLEIANVKGEERVALEMLRQNAMTGRNDATIAARLEAAAKKSTGQAGNILGAVQAGKMNFEKAATAFEVMASMEQDEQRAQQYADMAKRFATANMTQKSAAAGTKPDLEAMGIKTNQFELGVGGAPVRMGPGAVAPAGPNLNPTNNGRGDPPKMSGMPTAEDREKLEAFKEMKEIEIEYAMQKDPEAKKVLLENYRQRQALVGNSQAPGQPAQAQAPAAPAKPQAPSAGTIYKGYRFKGGNPADKANWEKV